MALIDPRQIHALLKSENTPAGLSQASKRDIKQLCADAGLSPEEILENLGSIMRTGESEGIRMRAVENALKVNGLLQPDEVKQDLTVNIIIQDSQFEAGSINPILVPRSV